MTPHGAATPDDTTMEATMASGHTIRAAAMIGAACLAAPPARAGAAVAPRHADAPASTASSLPCAPPGALAPPVPPAPGALPAAPFRIDQVRAARVGEVEIDDPFWNPRLAANRERTAWANFEQCERTGRIENLRRAGAVLRGQRAPASTGEFQGLFFNDSDVYKAVEGACWVLAAPAASPDPRLRAKVDEIVEIIAAAQHPDGYVNSYFTLAEPGKRWTNLKDMHELYCAGHLIEAAIAHHSATGGRRLLDAAVRFADLICDTFGPHARRDVCGHEEIELALFALAEHTGQDKYRATAEFFINERGRGANLLPPQAPLPASSAPSTPAAGDTPPGAPSARPSYGEYCQDHLPVRDQREVVGHAVRAMYFFTAATHMARLNADRELMAAMDRLWHDLTARKTYVTGGIGPSAHNEGFTIAYDLPNDTAYAETCAGIGSVLWNHEMLLASGNSKHADAMERALYNGVLSGVSLAGDRFFYVNPLETGGAHARVPWFDCACCPPNILRVLARLATMVYSVADDGVWINLYAGSRLETHLGDPGGRLAVRVQQQTNYPWDGAVRITIAPEREAEFVVRMRVPGWSRQATLSVNGAPFDAPTEKGYIAVRRTWKAGDTIDLEMAMPVDRVYAHPAVEADRGRVALRRGPLVYCFESADNPAGEGQSLRDVVLSAAAELSHEWTPDLLGGCVVVRGEGVRVTNAQTSAGPGAPGKVPELAGLYQAAKVERVRLTGVPYSMWGNRGADGVAAEMIVWMPETPAAVRGGDGIGGWGLSGATPSASHCWRLDRVEAIADGRAGASSADESVPRMTFWPRKGGESHAPEEREWVRLDFPGAGPTETDAGREVSACGVYWFRDVPRGGCDLPLDADVFALAEGAPDENAPGAWERLGSVACEADGFNWVRFAPRQVRALRLDVRLKDAKSAGILEWRVE